MLRSLLLCPLLAITAVGPAKAQAPPNQRAPSDLAAIVDSVLQPLLALRVFDGTILVARGNEILLEAAYGEASREHGVPNRPDTAFRIASISKSFTRALVGRLAERGVLSLDDPLARWLPAFPEAERITIRLLLDHRAGVPNVNSIPWDEEALAPPTLADLVGSLQRLPLDFEPGSDQRYSNGGYAVLAHAIERATSRAYEDVLEEEILKPLGLDRTAHEGDFDVVPGLATGYVPSPAIWDRTVRAPFQGMETKKGGGSLVSTARDLLRWVRAIGRSAILEKATWDDLFPPADGPLAFQGRSPGYNAFLFHDRERDVTAVGERD